MTSYLVFKTLMTTLQQLVRNTNTNNTVKKTMTTCVKQYTGQTMREIKQ